MGEEGFGVGGFAHEGDEGTRKGWLLRELGVFGAGFASMPEGVGNLQIGR